MASERANYFKIGLFVIAALTILIVTIVVLGAGALFRRKIVIESYFVESVQGLDIGSPVKFRGVQVGKVDDISLAGKYYPTELRHVLVRVALFPDTFRVKSQAMIGPVLKKEIDKGLRVQLSFQGVTGTAYLETDYLDPDRYPPLDIDWIPEYPYIPSATSTITRISESVDRLFRNLEEINIEGLARGLRESLDALTSMARGANVERIGEEAEALLSEMRESNARLAGLLAEVRVEPLMTDMTETAATLRRIAADTEEPLSRLLTVSREASQKIRDAATTLEPISGDVSEGLAAVRRTVRRIDRLIARQQEDIEVTIENIRQISDNLQTLTEDARAYPSRVFFSDAPGPAAGATP